MRYRHFSNLHQLALGVVGFVALILLLDTGGLNAWATRLDLGPERTVAVPITDDLARLMQPLHSNTLRRRELALLGRVGWSDDPADTVAADTVAEDTPPATTDPPLTTATDMGLPSTTHSSLATSTPATTRDTTSALGNMLPTTLKDPPLIRAPLHLVPLPPASPVRTVALAGDSMMAVGLAPNLLNHAPQHPELHFVKAFKSGTGLARPEVFNWQKEYPAMLGSAHPDVILVAIGANDGQGFVEGKITYPFATDAWQQVYAARVETYLRMLDRDGAQVLWLGLPPMKSAAYNTHIALVNRVTYAVVTQHPRATWVSLAGLVGDNTGGFREYATVGDRTQPLRQPDGIHLSDAGATLVTAELLPWLTAASSAPPSAAVPLSSPPLTPPPAMPAATPALLTPSPATPHRSSPPPPPAHNTAKRSRRPKHPLTARHPSTRRSR